MLLFISEILHYFVGKKNMKNFINVVYSTHLTDKKNNDFENNIKNTIGVKHKIIKYTNFNEYSLTYIYNDALKKYSSRNSIFVFVHNDIIFETRNWGRIILSRLNESGFDIIGLAGTKYLDNKCIWWSDSTKLVGIVNHTDGVRTWASNFSDKLQNGYIEEVVAIDGVFMAVNPDNIVSFDENIKGFHFYDVKFSIDNYLEGNNIGVTTDITITHKSIGIVNEEWQENRKLVCSLACDELPLSTENKLIIDNKIINIDNVNVDEYSIDIVIPTKNNYESLERTIKSIVNKTKFNNYNIYIADTGSDNDTITKYDYFSDLLSYDRLTIVYYDYYNFAKINNDMVSKYCKSKYLIFCNDDIELLNDSISHLVESYNILSKNEKVGTLGIRMMFPDNSVQHNGIFCFFDNDKNLKIGHIDYKKVFQYKSHGVIESIGNTAAFLFIKKDDFIENGMFNEDYIECFEDVELNIKLFNNGFHNYTNTTAVAYHNESTSRKKSLEKQKNEKIDYQKLINFLNNN